jgi:acetoin utilization protein AcuB
MSSLDSPLDSCMTKDPLVIDPDDEVEVAETMLRLGRANEWPVARGRSLLGVVTMGDLLAERDADATEHATSCADVMSAASRVASPSDPIAHVALEMHAHRLSCYPVVDGDELVGLVTLTDFVRLAVEQLEEETRRFGGAPIVAHLMSSSPTTVTRNDTLIVARELMAAFRIRHLPVRDRARVVGIVAQRDLVAALGALSRPAWQVTVGDIMTPHPQTTTPECDAARAGRILVHHGVGALPVVRGDHLVGILSKRDFLRYLVSLSPVEREWS